MELTPLGNEVDGVLVTNDASNNHNRRARDGPGQHDRVQRAGDGVQVNGAGSDGDASCRTAYIANGGLGIVLVDGGNNLQRAPVLTSVTIARAPAVVVQGTLNSMPEHRLLDSVFR